MKKVLIMAASLAAMLFVSCASTSGSESSSGASSPSKVSKSESRYILPETVDPATPDEELVKLTIKKNAVLNSFDNYASSILTFGKNNEAEMKELDQSMGAWGKERNLYVLPGNHTLNVSYNSSKGFAMGSTLRVTLEAGKSYNVLVKIEGKKVIYDVQDAETNETIIPANKLTMKQKLAISYTGLILQPVSEGRQMILLGNEISPNDNSLISSSHGKYDYTIEYGPDLSVTYTEKGKTHKGFIGFEATQAIIYIKFDDAGALTKEDFLKLDPKSCDRVYGIESTVGMFGVLNLRLTQEKPKKTKLLSLSVK